MADTSVSVEVNISYNDPRLKKLHEELEKLVRDGESDIHVVMVVDGKCYQLDMQPMPTTDGRHLNDDRSSFEEQALRMCEFPNPNSLLFRISRLAYSVAIGRAEAAKGGRALDSVFDDLQKCSIAVHEEAVKSLASPTDSTGG